MTAQRTRSGSRKEPGALSLLAEILDNRPNLPEARCRTNRELFDDIVDGKASRDDKNYARGLCRRCVHSAECPDSLARPEIAKAG
ncbi:hypothetical protein EEB12_26700 [Rhodococcus sp. WS1]|nr:hypothetical protein EEB12_26700 [Rhodococcus sp. WS1]